MKNYPILLRNLEAKSKLSRGDVKQKVLIATRDLEEVVRRIGEPESQQRNSIITEIEVHHDSIKSSKRIIDAKEKELKEAEKNVKNLVKIRASKPLQKRIETILAKYKISFTKYHGGSLIGEDCHRLLENCDVILNDISEVLLDPSARRLHVRPDIDSDIKMLIANLKDLMNLFNHCCSVMASQDKG